MAATYTSVDNCTTVKEDTQQYALLPPNTKGYLVEKVETALKVPIHLVVKLKGGQTVDVFLKQVVVSTTIRLDEAIADYRWQYKAEVSFDMTPSITSSGRNAPSPFLSTSFKAGPPDPDRRHSLNPFPSGRKAGLLRRPDVIIVRNPALRWPSRGVIDHDGAAHADNLLRLVEIKFPGDDWGRGQEQAYQAIAGGANRMSVLDVSDCDGDLERARQQVRDLRAAGKLPALVPSPSAQAAGGARSHQDTAVPPRLRAPVRSVVPIRAPVWFEDWIPVSGPADANITAARRAVESLWNNAQRGVAEVSGESKAWVRQNAPWLFDGGQWTQELGQHIYRYVDEKGNILQKVLGHQIQAVWRQIREQTDLSWEELKQVQWSQIATFVGDHKAGLVACLLLVAGVVLIVVLAPVLLAALAWLLSLVGTTTLTGMATLLAAQRLTNP